MGLVTLNLPQKSSSKVNDGDTLKRRLLGAAVLIALAVIFLPLLLDGSGSESRFRRVEQLRTQPPRIIGADGKLEVTQATTQATTQAATMPAASLNKANKPVSSTVKSEGTAAATNTDAAGMRAQAAERAAAREAELKRLQQATVKKTAIPASNSVSSEGKSSEVKELVAWIVQAGSFSNEQNALSLRDELRGRGFPSFVTLADAGGQSLYRVKVGPMTDRAKADNSKTELEKIVGRETIVRQYP